MTQRSGRVDLEDFRVRISELATGLGGRVAVSILDLESGEGLGINQSESFPAASLVKIPIMVEVFRQASEGLLRWDTWVEIGAEDQVTGAGVIHALAPGIRFRASDLVKLMIVVSDNTAANILLDMVGIDAVNETMQRAGLHGTRIYNKLQIVPVGRQGGNVTTAEDMTFLLAALSRGEIVSWDACRRMVDIMKRQQFKEGLPSRLPVEKGAVVGACPSWQIAHKTGSLSNAFHDAGIVFLPNRAFVISILTRDVTESWQACDFVGRVCRMYVNRYLSVGSGSDC